MFLFIDFETCSEADIRLGSEAYARHPSTRATCLAWAVDDEPVRLWRPPEPLPRAVTGGHLVVAHNAEFDLAILRHLFGVAVSYRDVVDTVALARAYGLPGKLGALATFLGLGDKLAADDPKRKAGIRRCFKPATAPPADDPRWQDLFDYCVQDVELLRSVHREFLRRRWGLFAGEREVWIETMERNLAGVPVDLNLLPRAVSLMEKFLVETRTRFEELTGLPLGTSNAAAFGLPNLRKATVEEAIENGALSEVHREALTLRLLANQAAVKKLPAMLRRADPTTGLVHNVALYHGAHTGRDTSSGLQVHNLKRSKLDGEALFEIERLITSGELLEEEDPIAVLASFVRPMIHHPERLILVGDFAQIEARVTAWLAGNTPLLAAFANGEDAYKTMAARLFKIDAETVSSEQRRIGKEVVLACGFGMGVSKFFKRMQAQGVNITREEARDILYAYRSDGEDLMPRLWNTLDSMAGGKAPADPDIGARLSALGVSFQRGHAWLSVTLPSGRRIWYWHVHHATQERSGTPEELADLNVWRALHGREPLVEFPETRALAYSKPTGQHVTLHRGVVTENLVQAIARDFMVIAASRLQRCGFDVRFTVHDEVVALKRPEQTLFAFRELMQAAPPWRGWETFPVRVDAACGVRYTK